ncbi:TadE family type IV pilus minor pilin [Streptomyces sirii]|uniref:TadE family type IV pilus minor pilin n=1 Tax=Streptomyces sirii TaxID=3127701 RepID=UPI003D360A94
MPSSDGRSRAAGSGRGRGRGRGTAPGPRGAPRTARDAGFVTAETAVVLPVLVTIVAALIWGLLAVCARIECVDAARAGARAAARSEPRAAVIAAAEGAAPRGARVALAREGDLVRVRVEAGLPGVGRLTVQVTGEAVALAEETVR